MIGTDDRAIIKLYSGTLLQLFHVTWHIIIGQKGGMYTSYAMNPRNLKDSGLERGALKHGANTNMTYIASFTIIMQASRGGSSMVRLSSFEPPFF